MQTQTRRNHQLSKPVIGARRSGFRRGLGLVVLLLGLLLPLEVQAEVLKIMPGWQLQVALPNEEWQAGLQPPPFLIEERLTHLSDGMLAMMKEKGVTDRRQAVEAMLGRNEAFIFNSATGAHLDVDFSPLGETDEAPTAETLRNSAEFAGQALAAEENYTEVAYRVSTASIAGLESVQRLDASYLRDGQPGEFIGLIGFRSPYWVFFYYTDPEADAEDRRDMAAILGSLRVVGP